MQTGFVSDYGAKQTPRNLMGFKDGTSNPAIGRSPSRWTQSSGPATEAPAWMRGGSYLVVRRIRIALEHWDRMKVAFQEQTFGRAESSPARRSAARTNSIRSISTPTDADGNPVMPENSHVRLAHAGEQRRRARSCAAPIPTTTAPISPPSAGRPGGRAWSTTPACSSSATSAIRAAGFIKIFEKMSRFDMMNQFVTHTGGGLFACPGGVAEGEFIGQRLFEAAS